MSRGAETRAAVIRAGLALWRQGGEPAVSARKIASMVGMTHAGVIYSWKTAERMRADIALQAVRIGDAAVIRQLIVANHPAVAHMDQATRVVWLSGA